MLAGEDPLDLGPAPGPAASRHPLLERVFTLLVGALSRMLEGRAADGLMELARLGCEVEPATPGAAVHADIAKLLERQRRYSQTRELDGRRVAGFHLVLAAAALAATPNAPLHATAA